MAPHSSTLAWKIPWMEEPGRLQTMGSIRVGHDWATSLSLFTFMHWRRKWQPTPVFLPGESQGWGSLLGCWSMGSHRVGHDWSNSSSNSSMIMLGLTSWRLNMNQLLFFSYYVTSDSFQPHELQHAVHESRSFTISLSLLKLMSIESVMPFNHLILCCPLLLLPSVFFPLSGSFPVSQFFESGGQSIGASASAAVLPMNS